MDRTRSITRKIRLTDGREFEYTSTYIDYGDCQNSPILSYYVNFETGEVTYIGE